MESDLIRQVSQVESDRMVALPYFSNEARQPFTGFKDLKSGKAGLCLLLPIWPAAKVAASERSVSVTCCRFSNVKDGSSSGDDSADGLKDRAGGDG